MKKEGISPEDMDTIINKKSGLLGITGISQDMREVRAAADKGDEIANLAIDMYCYRIKKYISAYTGALGGLDVLVFTAGVGENAYPVREKSCEGLEFLGIEIDKEINKKTMSSETLISTPEEIVIAREAERLCGK
jgi:acetate kinase